MITFILGFTLGIIVGVRFRDCYDNENIAYDVSNGICLCKRCHKMVHGGGNYING